jgi:hypothetical protein
MSPEASALTLADERLREVRAHLERNAFTHAHAIAGALLSALPKAAKGERVRLGQALHELQGSLHQLVIAQGHEEEPWFAVLRDSAQDALSEAELALAAELKRVLGTH